MARAQNKQQLLDFGEHEYSRLFSLISQLTPDQRDHEYIFDNRTAKDLVAHLHAWTGSTNMATYFASALSSHYVWAIDLIRKHFKIKI